MAVVLTPGQLRILQAIEAMLKNGLGDLDFVREDYTLADPGEASRVAMFDGDPGAPVEQLLGGRHKTYRHEIPLEMVPRQIEPDVAAHEIHGRIKRLVDGDRWLGGLVDDLEWSELASIPVPVSETKVLRTYAASLIAEYTL